MTLLEELQWRGLLQDQIPGTDELLETEKITAYIGFDPTADSLHIGSLIQIFLLKHLQKRGHKPLAIIGGATGMVGDPSFKSSERPLLTEKQLQKNLDGIKAQFEKYLDFEGDNAAEIINNYDWMKDFSFLDFIREVGKHITVNYMMSKDSVRSRMETGISFTEFSYQLLQAYDFYWLYKHKNCRLQCGGSDQWGNITSGTELVRRMAGGKAFAFTCPLIMKADGTKFGKTEEGNVWLDSEKTSPYKFYQFWLNASDEDAISWIKKFTFLDRDEIDAIIEVHQGNPHQRAVQKKLAEEVTVFVHGREAYDAALHSSSILFGKSKKEALFGLDERNLLEVFEGVPLHEADRDGLKAGIPMIDFLSATTGILQSKGEARRSLKENAISLNKQKVNDQVEVSESDLICEKYLIIQKGKKNYFLVKVV